MPLLHSSSYQRKAVGLPQQPNSLSTPEINWQLGDGTAAYHVDTAPTSFHASAACVCVQLLVDDNDDASSVGMQSTIKVQDSRMTRSYRLSVTAVNNYCTE